VTAQSILTSHSPCSADVILQLNICMQMPMISHTLNSGI